MNWKTTIWAVVLLGLLSWGFGPDPLDDPQGCQEGTPGCLCDGIQGECRALFVEPLTCEECIGEQECEDLCREEEP